jgi:hypothetical protein
VPEYTHKPDKRAAANMAMLINIYFKALGFSNKFIG